jgi:hypothetical protein
MPKAPSHHKIITWRAPRQDQHYPHMSRICLGYGQRLSHRLRSSASTFVYIYHLLSIDLQSSRSCNSLHCKAYILYYRGLYSGYSIPVLYIWIKYIPIINIIIIILGVDYGYRVLYYI